MKGKSMSYEIHGIVTRIGPAFAHGGNDTPLFTPSRRLRMTGTKNRGDTLTLTSEAVDGDLDVLSLTKPGDEVMATVEMKFGKLVVTGFLNKTLADEG